MARILKPDFTVTKNVASRRTEPSRPPLPVYQLHIALSYTDPPIWRRLQVCGGQSLGELHRILQICFGWDDAGQHQFLVGKVFYKTSPVSGDSDETNPRHDDESRASLHVLAEAMKFIFTYIYDGGPGWEGEITLEETLPGSREHFAPRLMAGAGWTDATTGGGKNGDEIDLQAINLRLRGCYPVNRPTGLQTISLSSTDDKR